MNNDSTAINRNLRDLTGAIKEQNKRMREINSNLTQILYILKEFRDDQDEVENYISQEAKAVYGFAITKDNPAFDDDVEYMRTMVRATQRFLNDILQGKGFLTLNEACREFCIKEDPKKCCIGWLLDNKNETEIVIDFEAFDDMYYLYFAHCVNICSELKEREADDEEVNELRAHDLEGNEYVIRGAAIDVERPRRSYEEYFNRIHGRIVTEGMDCEDTEND